MPPPCKGRETSSLVAAAAVFHGPRSAGQSLEGKRTTFEPNRRTQTCSSSSPGAMVTDGRMIKETQGPVLAGIVSLLLFTSCGNHGSTSPPSGSTMESRGLLLEDPPLPETHVVLWPEPDVRQRREQIDWRLAGDRALSSMGCPGADEQVARIWSHEGNQPGHPEFVQLICRYPSADEASSYFASTEIEQVAGQDYPNFEPGTAIRDLYSPHWSPYLISTPAAELVCALGSASKFCGTWIFRGVYGSYVTRLFLHTGPGGTRFSAFLDTVRAVDRSLKSRTASAT